MKYYFALFSVVFLIGCSGYQILPSETYNPYAVKETELALLKAHARNYLVHSYNTYLKEVKDEAGNTIFYKSNRDQKVFWKELLLSPGKYTVKAYCINDAFEGSPWIEIDVQKGMSYSVECKSRRKETKQEMPLPGQLHYWNWIMYLDAHVSQRNI